MLGGCCAPILIESSKPWLRPWARTDHAARAASFSYRMQRGRVARVYPRTTRRAEMRERGMLLPDLPADIELGEDDG